MRLAGFLVRSLFRHPGRLALMLAPMGLAFTGSAIIASLETARDFAHPLDEAGRIVVIHRQSIMQPLPRAHVEQIARLEGIQQLSYASWFGGFYRQPENRFSQYAIDTDSYFSVYPEIELSGEELAAWRADPRAALVSARLAQRFGWRRGDLISLSSTIWQQRDGGMDWPLLIVAILPADAMLEPEALYLRHDYFDDNRRFGQGTLSYAVARLAEGAAASAMIAKIDAVFANSSAPTFSSKESDFIESFQRQLGDLRLITRLVRTILVFVVLLVASSALAQAIAERRRELGIMQALGFSRRRIAAGLVLETTMAVALAALLALALAALSLEIAAQFVTSGPFLGARLVLEDSVKLLLAALILGVLGSLFPLVPFSRRELAIRLRE